MWTTVYKVKCRIQLGLFSCNCAKATNYARVRTEQNRSETFRPKHARVFRLIVELVDWKSESGLLWAGHFLYHVHSSVYQFQTIDISREEEAATLQNRILPSPQVVGDAAAEGSQSSESTSGPLSSQHPMYSPLSIHTSVSVNTQQISYFTFKLFFDKGWLQTT